MRLISPPLQFIIFWNNTQFKTTCKNAFGLAKFKSIGKTWEHLVVVDNFDSELLASKSKWSDVPSNNYVTKLKYRTKNKIKNMESPKKF